MIIVYINLKLINNRTGPSKNRAGLEIHEKINHAGMIIMQFRVGLGKIGITRLGPWKSP